MNLLAAVGRSGVSVWLTLAACALLALPAQASAGSDSTPLTPVDRPATQSFGASVKRVVDNHPTTESAAALLAKQQAKAAVATPDDREFPFPRGWMLALLAVLVVVLVDRARVAAKSPKLNDDARRSSGLSAPLARS